MNTRPHPVNVISAIESNREQSQLCRRLLPTKEAAAYLGVSAGILRGWRDRIRPIKLSATNWLYDIRDLDRFVDELKREKG